MSNASKLFNEAYALREAGLYQQADRKHEEAMRAEREEKAAAKAEKIDDKPPARGWRNLTSDDKRKPAAVRALRQAAKVKGGRVTTTKISKCGQWVSGRVLAKTGEPETVARFA